MARFDRNDWHGQTEISNMRCHLVFQHFLNELIRKDLVLYSYPASAIKSLRLGFAMQAQQAIASTVELFGISVLLENQLHKPMKVF